MIWLILFKRNQFGTMLIIDGQVTNASVKSERGIKGHLAPEIVRFEI